MAATAAPAPRARTFAALLEEYAAPSKFLPTRDLDGLEDDVATLSHENALKAHARYRSELESAPIPAQSAMAEQAPLPPPGKECSALPVFSATAALASLRRSASVTVRLTASESDQLHARAAEAGLTVSAYLRSCAFEVESLRAQVKEAVAQMKQAEERGAKRDTSWIRRLFAWTKCTPDVGRIRRSPTPLRAPGTSGIQSREC